MKKLIIAILMMVATPLAMMAQKSSATPKFGHFDSSVIMQAMPEFKSAQDTLQALGNQYDEEIKRLQNELQKKHEEYEAQKNNLLEPVRQRREQELTELNNRFQQSLQDSQVNFQKVQNEKLQAIQKKLLEAVKKVGDAGGYVYIMDTAAGIPYISTTISNDVSVEIKKALGI
ncbi:MAG: OmpH family outer membrane protein [Bacteroidaceae bacterium]|nr:OmpH family outer membrane protein [Bacteroidaceae bacterium]